MIIKNLARNGIALRREVPAADKPGPAGRAGRRLTRDSWVVSLEILWFPATISGFPDFFRKISCEIEKIGFLDSRDQNQILNFL